MLYLISACYESVELCLSPYESTSWFFDRFGFDWPCPGGEQISLMDELRQQAQREEPHSLKVNVRVFAVRTDGRREMIKTGAPKDTKPEPYRFMLSENAPAADLSEDPVAMGKLNKLNGVAAPESDDSSVEREDQEGPESSGRKTTDCSSSSRKPTRSALAAPPANAFNASRLPFTFVVGRLSGYCREDLAGYRGLLVGALWLCTRRGRSSVNVLANTRVRLT
jgi:hypothetical protein